jgi:hypothetical protein
MPKVVDLTGQNFGRLVVVRQAGKRVRPNGSTATKWLCICECGRETIVERFSLISGKSAIVRVLANRATEGTGYHPRHEQGA